MEVLPRVPLKRNEVSVHLSDGVTLPKRSRRHQGWDAKAQAEPAPWVFQTGRDTSSGQVAAHLAHLGPAPWAPLPPRSLGLSRRHRTAVSRCPRAPAGGRRASVQHTVTPRPRWPGAGVYSSHPDIRLHGPGERRWGQHGPPRENSETKMTSTPKRQCL